MVHGETDAVNVLDLDATSTHRGCPRLVVPPYHSNAANVCRPIPSVGRVGCDKFRHVSLSSMSMR